MPEPHKGSLVYEQVTRSPNTRNSSEPTKMTNESLQGNSFFWKVNELTLMIQFRLDTTFFRFVPEKQ